MQTNPTAEETPTADSPSAIHSAQADSVGVSSFVSAFSHLRFWAVAVLGLVADLHSKDWAFQRFHQGGHQEVIPHLLEFSTTFNTGALFGIGRGQTHLFVAASILALILVLWMFARSSSRRWLLHLALGAILAGALGNMYDRIFVQLHPHALGSGRVAFVQQVGQSGDFAIMKEYPPDHPDSREVHIPADQVRKVGCVRDFIKIPTRIFGEKELWPWVFNIADMLLVFGVGILAIYLWRDRAGPPEPADNTANTDAQPNAS